MPADLPGSSNVSDTADTTERPQTRGQLLSAISNAMVGIHKECYGKGPTRARTIYTEDTVLCRLEEPFMKAEKTLIGVGRTEEVRNMRLAFQRALQDEFVGAVEGLTGRRVEAFISETHIDPDLALEIFLLEEEDAVQPEDPSAQETR
ncbi:MAG: DUF2294 domain-containing protein [Actinomycetota bacterium]|nr:DUF2294 domain-containing protein [Actinomycetota bacterium]